MSELDYEDCPFKLHKDTMQDIIQSMMRKELIDLEEKQGETIIIDCNIIPSLEMKDKKVLDQKEQNVSSIKNVE
jgi:aminoglycoside phosphotransferase